jgi:selenocysteine-specific elongation factor
MMRPLPTGAGPAKEPGILKQIILGTAGHIDHGKTSLIKAVTGINTDRLKEEQLRGITIELGFASLMLPSGLHLGIVDVPGHEKFVKNMVAGVTGIDLLALVIAADEGIMPQTREHMEICTLLGIRYGLVVLTKIDLVDEEWLEMVTEEVKAFTRGTFLENAPVIPFSAVSGAGTENFIKMVDTISEQIPPRSSSGLFRLPIDRVFSMKGFGTVITGTLASGKVNVGDRVMIYPSGEISKVRGLQVHNQSVQTAVAGMRTAINFQGLDKTEVDRGDVVAAPDTLVSSYMVDVHLHYLASNQKAIKNRRKVRFHTGTSEIMGTIILLDRDELAPGEQAAAQVRLDTSVTLVKDDSYVLRSYSPVRTIGGGKVLNPLPVKHKRHRPEVVDLLNSLVEAGPEEVVQQHIAACGFAGCSYRDLRIAANLPEKQLDIILQAMLSRQDVLQIDKEKRIFVHQAPFKNLQDQVRSHLSGYHTINPLKAGMPKEELKSKLPAGMDIKLYTMVLNQMVKTNSIVQQDDIIHLAEHQISLGVDQQTLREQILETYLKSGITPPFFKEVRPQLNAPDKQIDQVLNLLVDERLLIRIKEDFYYHCKPLDELKNKLIDYLTTHEEITTPQFKDMTGASRKYVIALIEYFDNIQLTLRVGDVRKLRKRPTPKS